jgi:nitronate monooxygenase
MSPAELKARLTLPVIGAPMFIVSGPELVIAQCQAGIVGSFPALNARPPELLDQWLRQIRAAVGDAPFAVNQIVHPSNTRLERDLDLTVQHRVPIVITSLRAPGDVVKRVHEYGGLVFHDVINIRHAEKALAEGVDGLILVCAGAGGHAGTLSPFALVAEVRRIFAGPLILAGAIASGRDVLAAQAMGADFAYMGTRFIASREANAVDAYKQAIVAASAGDIVYTPCFTGVSGNYLKASIIAAGLDPDHLPASDKTAMDFGSGAAKAWRDIWGAGQGVGAITDIPTVADLVGQLAADYRTARQALTGPA